MKKIILILLVLSFSITLFSAEKITGIWKIISDETGLLQSITLIYEYKGKIYGRLLVTYEDDGKLSDNKKSADSIIGEPTYVGLDFIWGLIEKKKKWSKGKILDPVPGKIYSCDMWIKNGQLIVKGKIGPFGRAQTWVQLKDRSELPKWVIIPKSPTPKIPKVK
ncbi:MAG: DUF2147 domain-containing protein [Spirochaetaceae bacterium]